MIPALAFVAGAVFAWAVLWFIEWLLFTPSEPENAPFQGENL